MISFEWDGPDGRRRVAQALSGDAGRDAEVAALRGAMDDVGVGPRHVFARLEARGAPSSLAHPEGRVFDFGDFVAEAHALVTDWEDARANGVQV